MEAVTAPLEDLRTEVDRIDRAILDLLIERTEVVRRIGLVKADRLNARLAARPAREAVILRRLAAAAGERFPRPVLVRMWRELLAATTRLQTPLSVSVFTPQQHGFRIWDLARDQFGSVTPMTRVDSATQALRSVSDGSAAVAVLPLPNDDEPWWLALISDHHDRLRVFARLPFVASAAGDGEEASALALGRIEPEQSGDDLALLAIEARIRRLARAPARSAARRRAGAGMARRMAGLGRARGGPSGGDRQLHPPGRRARRRGAERGARRDLADRAGRRLPSAAAAGLDRAAAATAVTRSSLSAQTSSMANLRPRPGILEIEPYVGGKSELAGAARVIKLSANESALGPSPKAVAALQEAALTSHRYPDGDAAGLRAAIGGRFQLDPARIVCGAGSDELIQLLLRAYAGPGDEVVYSAHGFLMYKLGALGVGAMPVAAPERGLRADVDALLARVGSRTRMVFVANPNNPTGSYLPAEELARLHDGNCPDDVLLVIDAAYAEYVRANDYSAGIELVDRADNVVMTRTFSKLFGLAALRLGWLYGPPAVVDVLNRLRGPFNVGTPAQVAGIAALEDLDHQERSRAHNERWLPWLAHALAELGLTVHPSIANFVLVEFAREGERTARRRQRLARGARASSRARWRPMACRIACGCRSASRTRTGPWSRACRSSSGERERRAGALRAGRADRHRADQRLARAQPARCRAGRRDRRLRAHDGDPRQGARPRSRRPHHHRSAGRGQRAPIWS